MEEQAWKMKSMSMLADCFHPHLFLINLSSKKLFSGDLLAGLNEMKLSF